MLHKAFQIKQMNCILLTVNQGSLGQEMLPHMLTEAF